APSKVASQHFIGGAATPPQLRRGIIRLTSEDDYESSTIDFGTRTRFDCVWCRRKAGFGLHAGNLWRPVRKARWFAGFAAGHEPAGSGRLRGQNGQLVHEPRECL